LLKHHCEIFYQQLTIHQTPKKSKRKIMKAKLLIRSAALTVMASAATFLLIESCTKSSSPSVKPVPNINKAGINLALPGSTVAYQDNTITNWFKRNTNSLGAIAFDQAASVPLANGKVLWLNGDTYYNDLNTDGTTPCLFNYHNTVLQQPSTTNWTQSATVPLLYATSPQIFTDFSPAYFWPADGVEIGTKVYTYLTEMSGINYVGGKVGVFNEADNSVSYSTVTLPALDSINFGNGMVKVGTTVYAYGTKLLDGYGDTQVYVAKFSTSSPNTWTFWNGTTWAPAPSRGHGVVANTTSNGLCVSYVNGKYVMIYTQFNYQCDEGTGIYGSKSTSPTGGFSTPIKIYDIPDRKAGHTPHYYTPIVHPEFTVNNEFLLTYCINTYAPCVASCNSNKAVPDDYRPRAVRVPYVVLGL
jgi:hypothetical protein